MSVNQISIGGTLGPNGTVQLDQLPNLPPGRVHVTLQPAQGAAPPLSRLADLIDEIHKEQRARGFQGRSEQEIDAGLREGETEYEARVQAARNQPQPGRPTGKS